MDYRDMPPARPWDREQFTRRDRPPQTPRGRGALLFCLAPYTLAATIIGLPLAFPDQHLIWLWLNAGLALATGCLIACAGE